MELDKIVKIIARKLRISENEVYEMINEKKREFYNMINDLAAAYLIAYENKIEIKEEEEVEVTSLDLTDRLRNVSIEGIVIRKFPEREFEKDGSKSSVMTFLLYDGENRVRIVVWSKTLIETLKRIPEGSKVRVFGGYVKKKGERIEIHLGSDSKIVLVERGFGRRLYLNNPVEGMKGYIVGIVRKVFDSKSYSGGIVNKFIIDDGTGTIACVYFGKEEKIKKEDIWKEFFFIGRFKKNYVTGKIEFVADEIIEYDPKKELNLVV